MGVTLWKSFWIAWKQQTALLVGELFVDIVNLELARKPGGLFIYKFLDGGLFEGGAYTRGAYKIIVDIMETLLRDLVYFRRNFFMSI